MRYLGQHFLIQKNIVKKIVDVTGLRKNDVVLEVGPGKGILTEHLLSRTSQVIAVEKDKRLCDFLNNKFSNEIKEGELVLIEGDILKSKILNLKSQNYNSKSEIQNLKQAQKIELPKNYKIVANIPYYITSRFLKIFLEEAENQPQKMVLMLQKEVAERICETLRLRSSSYGGQAKMSLLALSVQVYGNPKIAFKVSASNFFPPPQVDSAVIVIDKISKKFFNDISEKKFFRVVKCGFSKKRKILLNNLLNEFGVKKENLENAFKKCGINNLSRAENLSLQDWKCLCKFVF